MPSASYPIRSHHDHRPGPPLRRAMERGRPEAGAAMSVVDRLPASARGRWLVLSAAAGVWAAAYWINGWPWDLLLYDVLGMAPAARPAETIHFFTAYAGSGNVFGVLVAVIVGIPLYSNAAGVMPLVLALHEKGLPMGMLLAFMTKVLVQVAPSKSPLNGSPARRSARSGSTPPSRKSTTIPPSSAMA